MNLQEKNNLQEKLELESNMLTKIRNQYILQCQKLQEMEKLIMGGEIANKAAKVLYSLSSTEERSIYRQQTYFAKD